MGPDLGAGGADRLVELVPCRLELCQACCGRIDHLSKVGQSLLELEDRGADRGAQLVILRRDSRRELLGLDGLAEPLLGFAVVAASLVREVCPFSEAAGQLTELGLMPVQPRHQRCELLWTSGQSDGASWQRMRCGELLRGNARRDQPVASRWCGTSDTRSDRADTTITNPLASPGTADGPGRRHDPPRRRPDGPAAREGSPLNVGQVHIHTANIGAGHWMRLDLVAAGYAVVRSHSLGMWTRDA
jgi:hypothetical protein